MGITPSTHIIVPLYICLCVVKNVDLYQSNKQVFYSSVMAMKKEHHKISSLHTDACHTQNKLLEAAAFLDCGTDLGSGQHVPGELHSSLIRTK